MSAPKYVYQDEDGAALTVNPYPHVHAGDIAAVSTGGTVYVLPEHFREVAAGLWTGAGLPPPVILERPKRLRDGELWFGPDLMVLRDALGNRIQFGGETTQPLDVHQCRALAAYLAAAADDAEAAAEKAEVEELATVLHDAREVGVKGEYGEWDLYAARAALRWMRGRQRGEGRS